MLWAISLSSRWYPRLLAQSLLISLWVKRDESLPPRCTGSTRGCIIYPICGLAVWMLTSNRGYHNSWIANQLQSLISTSSLDSQIPSMDCQLRIQANPVAQSMYWRYIRTKPESDYLARSKLPSSSSPESLCPRKVSLIHRPFCKMSEV